MKANQYGKAAVIIRASIGFLGFYAGAGLHIISPLALSDPLFFGEIIPTTSNKRFGVCYDKCYAKIKVSLS